MERTCSITGTIVTDKEGVMWMQLRPALQTFVKTIHDGIDAGSFISYKALNNVLHAYVANLTAEETKAHDALVDSVSKEYAQDEELQPLHTHPNEKPLTFGERLSDKIADFGGSWRFIIIFLSILVVWMLINSWYLASKAFDPYPYILLNLMLSCVAALQAPVIMMSQNRQEDKDRERAEYDVKVNVKAEKEIQLLHQKIDHLLLHQHRNMIELFQLHLDLTEQVQQRIDTIKNETR
ncbi:hypothetical protein CAP35_04110 [Chitinophagaceae bacterium IBVUCB1]|jgi:uncharacterized membrane protein|nr:hypothetical protein CAP35_04110 [Chitinophagaceae bacterium IBVUCB1]